MHVHFEETLTRSDCVIQALSWMGKVPDILPEEDGWKLNRNNYYQVQTRFVRFTSRPFDPWQVSEGQFCWDRAGLGDSKPLTLQHWLQEGWLATGNVKGIVGATFTTCHCKKNFDMPPRMNFNLRGKFFIWTSLFFNIVSGVCPCLDVFVPISSGHRAEVMLVKWNEPYQKLATCDANGIIFVWIKWVARQVDVWGPCLLGSSPPFLYR